MEAQNVTLAGILGDDLKHVLSVIGYDMTGVTVTFEISAGPEQPAMLTDTATLLDVYTDEDGVLVSIVEVFVAGATIRTAVDAAGGLPGNEPVTLYHQLKFSRLPGDLGTNAVTTIIYGNFIMKGEVK